MTENQKEQVINFEKLTLYPSNAQVFSSDPSMHPGAQSALAQPTLIGPKVRISNSKYHFPELTAYVCSARYVLKAD